MKGFQKGDPRAVQAGRKGGQTMRHQRTPDYERGYRNGVRRTTRAIAKPDRELAAMLRWLRKRMVEAGGTSVVTCEEGGVWVTAFRIEDVERRLEAAMSVPAVRQRWVSVRVPNSARKRTA